MNEIDESSSDPWSTWVQHKAVTEIMNVAATEYADTL